jgi:arylsulfatase A-like enzyme
MERASASTPWWPKELPEWDSLSWDEKKLFIKRADVFGAYLAYTDHEIGRVIQAVEDLGELNNTLIIYIAGDNGASARACSTARPASSPPSTAWRSYSATVALYLGFVGIAGGSTGILLWPVVVLHVVLTALLLRSRMNR